jgi:hypothetical protein
MWEKRSGLLGQAKERRRDTWLIGGLLIEGNVSSTSRDSQEW